MHKQHIILCSDNSFHDYCTVFIPYDNSTKFTRTSEHYIQPDVHHSSVSEYIHIPEHIRIDNLNPAALILKFVYLHHLGRTRIVSDKNEISLTSNR